MSTATPNRVCLISCGLRKLSRVGLVRTQKIDGAILYQTPEMYNYCVLI